MPFPAIYQAIEEGFAGGIPFEFSGVLRGDFMISGRGLVGTSASRTHSGLGHLIDKARCEYPDLQCEP